MPVQLLMHAWHSLLLDGLVQREGLRAHLCLDLRRRGRARVSALLRVEVAAGDHFELADLAELDVLLDAGLRGRRVSR